MDGKARLVLEAAVADLREIMRKLQELLPQAKGTYRDHLLETQYQVEAAIQDCNDVLARLPKSQSLPQRVGEAAFGSGGVGLVPPEFALPSSAFGTRH